MTDTVDVTIQNTLITVEVGIPGFRGPPGPPGPGVEFTPLAPLRLTDDDELILDPLAISNTTGLQAALDAKATALALAAEAVARAAADALKVDLDDVGAAGGVAALDGGGKVPTAQLPAITINAVFEVASQAAMLALAAHQGDVAIRSDQNKTYILSTNSPATLADWKLLPTPTDLVLSVAGKTGVVTLVVADVSGAASQVALDAVEDAAIAADVALDARVDDLEAGAVTLEGELDDEITRAEAAEAALDARLDAEEANTASDDSRLDALEAVAPTAGQKAALAGSSGTPGSGNKYVTDADARNSDTRTPADATVTTAKLSGALALPSGSTVVDQADGTNTTVAANTKFVQRAIALLINAAPSALDTLKELSDALGADPNFAATLATSLAGKQALNALLTAIATLTMVADRYIYGTGAGTVALGTITAAARGVLDDADTDTMLQTLVAAKLAGQLGGTSLLPDVRGLRETGGPQLLTMGALADGEYLKRSGTTLIGGTPSGGGGSSSEARRQSYFFGS